MKFIASLPIALKVSMIGIVGVLSFVLYLAYASTSTSDTTARLQSVRQTYFPLVEHSMQASTKLEDVVEAFSSAVSTADETQLETASAVAESVAAHLAEMQRLASENPRLASEARDTRTLMTVYYDGALDLSRSMLDGTADFGALGEQIERMQSQLEELRSALARVDQHARERFDDNIDTAITRNARSVRIGYLIASMITVVLAGTCWLMVRLIISNLDRVIASLADFAAGRGNLSDRIDYEGTDEIGQLVTSFNDFLGSTESSISEVVTSVSRLGDISTTMDDASHRFNTLTTEQTRSTETATNAISSLAQGITGITEAADRTSSIAQDAEGTARQGIESMNTSVGVITRLAEEVNDATRRMNELKNETDEVSGIVQVIQNIAEQTNLLALNAAIEAARAGEHGRGFAVVADEVRTLASQTQESTSRIQSMIGKLVTSTAAVQSTMEQGRSLAESSVATIESAGSAFNQITTQVNEIAEMNRDIATATNTQEVEVSRVQQCINELRESTEATARQAHDFVRMSASLVDISGSLSTVSSKFGL